MELKEFDGKKKEELAMIDVAKAILDQVHDLMHFNDLLSEVSEYLDLSDDEIESGMGQFYTDLNIDGRFISLGDNHWGLREWYPVDSIDEELTHDNDLEKVTPKQAEDGFDDLEHVEKEVMDDAKEELDDQAVNEDEENVAPDEITDDGDEDKLDEYSSDIEDLEDDRKASQDKLSIVDDEDVLTNDDDE